MNRNISQPTILRFPSADPRTRAASMVRRRESRLEQAHRLRCVSEGASGDVTEDRLDVMRARLLRMIIDNERMRNDGPRAS